MRNRRIIIAGIVALAMSARVASGDPASPYLHMRSSSHVVTDGGSKLELPPGYFMDEPTHDKVDAETKRLQDAEVKLTAENNSLRGSLAGWQPGWMTLAIATITGIAAGAYLVHSL